MIAFLISVFVLWLVWRWAFRWIASQDIQIAPPAPTTITINVLVKDVHVNVERRTTANCRGQAAPQRSRSQSRLT
jgi:hypothetical protein